MSEIELRAAGKKRKEKSMRKEMTKIQTSKQDDVGD